MGAPSRGGGGGDERWVSVRLPCLLYVSVSLSLSVGGSEFLCVCRSVCVSLGRRLAVCVSLSLGGEGIGNA